MPIEWLVERANVTQSWKKGEGESRGPDEERARAKATWRRVETLVAPFLALSMFLHGESKRAVVEREEGRREKKTKGPSFEAGLALWGSRRSWDLAQSLRHAGPPLVGWLGWLGAHREPTGPPTATIHRNRAPSNPSGSHFLLPRNLLPVEIILVTDIARIFIDNCSFPDAARAWVTILSFMTDWIWTPSTKFSLIGLFDCFLRVGG